MNARVAHLLTMFCDPWYRKSEKDLWPSVRHIWLHWSPTFLHDWLTDWSKLDQGWIQVRVSELNHLQNLLFFFPLSHCPTLLETLCNGFQRTLHPDSPSKTFTIGMNTRKRCSQITRKEFIKNEKTCKRIALLMRRKTRPQGRTNAISV